MKVSKYDKYKDAEMLWLDKIPFDWKVIRIKDIVRKIGSGVTPKGGSEIYVDSGITFLRSQNIYDDGLRIDDVSFITNEINQQMKNSQVRPKDILVNITGASIGRSCVIPDTLKIANINQHILFFRFKKSRVDFIENYLKSNYIKEYIYSVQSGTSKEALNMRQAQNFPLLVPPEKEQPLIVNFLLTKTSAIDKKVSLLETKIIYYKELSKSLVNETVCKGLNKGVTLKESGLQNVKQIPKHWQVKRLKDVGYLYSGLSGKSGEHFNQDVNDSTKYYIPFTNIASNKYINHEDLHNVIMEENERQNRVKKDDLFFLMSSEGHADIGKAALLIEDVQETYLNSFCKGYRVTKKSVVPRYLNYLLNATSFRDNLIAQGKGFTRINLKMEKVNDFEFLIPPVEEQTAIADFLDNKTNTIAAIITNITKQIEGLKELRKTLINDAVTGKLKVTE